MANWLLLIWIQSNDSGFPDPHAAIVAATYDSQTACIMEGPKVTIGAMYHVTYWACVQGGESKQ